MKGTIYHHDNNKSIEMCLLYRANAFKLDAFENKSREPTKGKKYDAKNVWNEIVIWMQRNNVSIFHFPEAKWMDGWAYMVERLPCCLLLKYHCLCCWIHQKRNNKSVLCESYLARINIYGERAHTHYIHCWVQMNGIHRIPFYCCDEEKKTEEKLLCYSIFAFGRPRVLFDVHTKTHSHTATKQY